MTNKVWSRDGEIFQYDSLCELIEDVNSCDEGDVSIGDTVYVGDAITLDTKRLIDIRGILENIGEAAYEEVGEWSEDWPKLDIKERELLQEMIADFIDKHSPMTFWKVDNAKEYVVAAEDLG